MVRIKVTTPTGRVQDADARDMRQMLGLNLDNALPINGLPEQVIQGVRVYVKPRTNFNRREHRILAICTCGKHVPVGRLHQHKCK